MSNSRSAISSRDHLRALLAFGVATSLMIVIAHAIIYMTHEYSHSFTAWALGWMTNPLALDYGHATLDNILFLGEVSDNVRYDPIFASGHGMQAAIIAMAGVVVGNAVVYFLLYCLASSPWCQGNAARMSVVFWLSLMCAGNVWSYVPIRALTTHADIALAARGVGVPTWVQFPFVLAPALFVIWHFFHRLCARSFALIAGGSDARTAFLVAVTSYWFFVFFVGDAAAGEYGPVSLVLAIVSKYLLFPLATLWLWQRYAPRSSAGA